MRLYPPREPLRDLFAAVFFFQASGTHPGGTRRFSDIIAGLAVGASRAEDLLALAAAYSLMAVTGPLAARLAAPGRSRAAVG